MMNANDVSILRELAKKYMEIAMLPIQEETAALYRGVNALKPVRPVVLMDEFPWHELDFDGSLTLLCEDETGRLFERYMRRVLFQWKYCRADMMVRPFIPVDKVFYSAGNGIDVIENVISQNDGNHIISHEYDDQFEDDESLNKLHFEKITYDAEETKRRFDLAGDIFEGIAPVKLTGTNSYSAVWDVISRYRGVTALLMDLVERPEFTHALVNKMTEIELDKIRQFEEMNLFEPYPSLIHCTAAITDELPGADFDPEHVRTQNIWGRGMAQIFAHVSKAMHDEFDIQYIKRVLDRFGLVYYGCCEPLHSKIDILEKISNLRKISITPWADVDIAAECIGKRYVLASKPNPAFVAGTFDFKTVEAEIVHVLEACKRNHTTCEFAIKDISTVGGRPQNLFDWEKCVMGVVKNFA